MRDPKHVVPVLRYRGEAWEVFQKCLKTMTMLVALKCPKHPWASIPDMFSEVELETISRQT